MDGRERWAIGIQDPKLENGARGILDTVYANDISLVSSGDYQRFYTVSGVRYNHIIDPKTLMPATRFSHVTVLHQDSGVADALSTALFLLPVEAGRGLLEENGAQGMWIGHNGVIEATDGFKAVSEMLGGYSAND
jgi:thiamine biosynthesis lipoprotein